MNAHANETQYFFDLTPERILDAVEKTAGLRCTGRCLVLNSMENRVYEVEIEIADESQVKSPSDRFRVVKFYRPGRWNENQLKDEHRFLAQLVSSEIPVIAPIERNGSTVHKLDDVAIWYTVFPKQGGRSPDELNYEQAERLGRLIARLHMVGASEQSKYRMKLTPQSYGLDNLKYLLDSNTLTPDIGPRYRTVVESICKKSEELFKGIPLQRIHGDCHFGNILWNDTGPFLVDFDDMVVGPCVQDAWLLMPGDDLETKILWDCFIEGYNQMKPFDRRWLRLVEPLRALRMIHYSAWIARRWNDPFFPRVFPHFGSNEYWLGQLADLEEQDRKILNTPEDFLF